MFVYLAYIQKTLMVKNREEERVRERERQGEIDSLMCVCKRIC